MYITQTQMVPQYIELRQCSTLGYCVCFLVKYVHNMIPAGSDQAWLVQTDSTVSLPGFPTLLSAEGDFFIIAGSIHITHNTFNNTSQSRRGEDRRERKRRSVTSQRKQDLKETSSGKTEKVQKPADPIRRTEETPLKNMCTYTLCYLWWVLCVTPWPAAPQTRSAGAPRRPERTLEAGSHPPASGPSAPGRQCGQSPPYCWLLMHCHLREQ